MVHGEKVMKLACPDNQIASARSEGIAGSEPIRLHDLPRCERSGLIGAVCLLKSDRVWIRDACMPVVPFCPLFQQRASLQRILSNTITASRMTFKK